MESKYISYDADMRTVLYRYAVMSNYIGISFDGTEKTVEKLSKSDAEEVLREGYSEQKERILFLCGTGVLNYANIKPLVIRNNIDFLSDVIELEKQLMADDEGKIPYSTLESALMVSANSKKHNLLYSVDFKSALALREYPDVVSEVNGFIACSIEYTEFLREIGFKFVCIDPYTGNVKEYTNIDNDNFFETLLNNLIPLNQLADAFKSEDEDINSKAYDYPLVADIAKCIKYLPIYDKIFGKDFLRETEENGLYFDDIDAAYEEYINDKKLTVNISGYVRRRKICGDIVNHFDYDYNTIENNELTKAELIKGQDFDAVIKLSTSDIGDDNSTAAMLMKALNKYKRQKILPDRFVAEIFYDKDIHYFVYDYNADKFTAVSTDTFTKQLFNFNKVWGLVRKAAAERRIIVTGSTITFPYINEIAVDEQIYALEMARDQYERQAAARKNSGQISTLKKLIADAKEGAENIAAEKAAAEEAKKARYAEAQAKKANRINNNAT